VVAYDQGFTTTDIQGNFEGIPPSETTSILKRDINGNITTDINTAVVTPRSPAAGYIAPEVNNFSHVGPATGSVTINILDPELINNFHTYRVEFYDSTRFHNNPKPYYSLIDYTSEDTLINLERLKGREETTPVLDGFSLDIINDSVVTIDGEKSGWIEGNSNYIVQVGFDSRYAAGYNARRVFYPADFEIHLTDSAQGDSSFPATGFSQSLQTNIIVKNTTENTEHFQFILRDLNTNGIFENGDALFLVFGDSTGKRANRFSEARFGWSVTFVKDTTIPESDQRPPQFGDVYKLSTTKPFRTGEYFEFVTKAPDYDQGKAQTDLDKIAVVPNPYTGAASWEPATSSVGRGERRIFFIHLPAKCTIRIYTISGKLVDTIEHESTLDDGEVSWNLVSKDGMDIAYGVYVYHVDAPGIGEKIDRFAVIK
jgi:hypothetical protein